MILCPKCDADMARDHGAVWLCPVCKTVALIPKAITDTVEEVLTQALSDLKVTDE
jgi:uncharacterized Zn finger protein (UPF0148 family)